MIKTPKKYPIEVALEKGCNKVSNSISWAIRTVVKFFFVIPKRKDDRTIYVMETLGWLLIGIGWVIITIARARMYFF